MGHHLENISLLHQELTEKLNISKIKVKELKVGLLQFSISHLGYQTSKILGGTEMGLPDSCKI